MSVTQKTEVQLLRLEVKKLESMTTLKSLLKTDP
jgi:hypothetical protein